MDPVIHFEMPADDAERVRAFYERAFGWQTVPLGPEPGAFVLAFTTESDPETRIPKKPGAINGGFYPRQQATESLRFTILVDDIHAAIDRVRRSGGTVLAEPFEMPEVGLFAMFADTEGNVVQLNQDFAVKQLPD